MHLTNGTRFMVKLSIEDKSTKMLFFYPKKAALKSMKILGRPNVFLVKENGS
jgi:hypothetical protein